MRRLWAAWALPAATLTALNIVLLVRNSAMPEPAGSTGPLAQVLSATAYLATAVVGALILSRHPRHRIGLICAVGGTAAALAAFASEYATAAPVSGVTLPAQTWLAWFGDWLWWAASPLTVMLLLLLFPDGDLPSPRWRPFAWAAAVSLLLVAGGHAFAPGHLHGEFSVVRNPAGLDTPGDVFGGLRAAGWVPMLASLGLGLAALAWRLRRATGERRQQLRWLLFAGAMGLVAIPVYAVTLAVGGSTPVVAQLLFGITFVALPVATGIAILKYRLYEIDPVINKALVVGGLAAFITAAYGATVAAVGALAGSVGAVPVSFAATAVVAVAFQPIRQRLQRLANQLVYGERLSPYEAITQFASRMNQALSADEVLPGMAEAATKGVGGDRARVRVFRPGGGAHELTWPAGSAAAFDHAVIVEHQGTAIGEIAVGKRIGEPVTARDAALLANLAKQAGPVLRNLGLTEELQARLHELQESRARIVSAQDRERRRVERDIHDGAQQTLVSMSAKVGLARRLLHRDEARTEVLLEELGQDISDTVDRLRDLARGVFPPLLTQRGLVAALEMHLLKVSQPARLVAGEDVNSTRFPAETEAALYFCAVEAVQNASKHAPGATIVVTVEYRDGQLVLAVTDDGPGFEVEPAQAAGGSGLQNMADRLAAVGGSVDVVSAPGRGTSVRGAVPAAPLLSAAQPDGGVEGAHLEGAERPHPPGLEHPSRPVERLPYLDDPAGRAGPDVRAPLG